MARSKFWALSLALGLIASPVAAQEGGKPTTTRELLQQVQAGWTSQAKELKQREADFLADKNAQAQKLRDR